MDFVVRLCVLGLSLCHYVYNNDHEDWNKIFYKLYNIDIHEFIWLSPGLVPYQWSGRG